VHIQPPQPAQTPGRLITSGGFVLPAQNTTSGTHPAIQDHPFPAVTGEPGNAGTDLEAS
jgi:hypothetical protein